MASTGESVRASICRVCNKGFTERELPSHQETAHGIIDFCRRCGKAVVVKALLNNPGAPLPAKVKCKECGCPVWTTGLRGRRTRGRPAKKKQRQRQQALRRLQYPRSQCKDRVQCKYCGRVVYEDELPLHLAICVRAATRKRATAHSQNRHELTTCQYCRELVERDFLTDHCLMEHKHEMDIMPCPRSRNTRYGTGKAKDGSWNSTRHK